MRPVGAAAVVQIADINEGKFSLGYQSAMSLLVIDFTLLEGRDGELVVKELTVVDSRSDRVSSCGFKRSYIWKGVAALNAIINQAIDHGFNWNDGDILYSELETVLHLDASSAVVVYCIGHSETQFIIGVMDRKFIDITEVR